MSQDATQTPAQDHGALLAEAVALLRRCEFVDWSYGEYIECCALCGGSPGIGHEVGCELAAFLRRVQVRQ